MRGRVVEQRVEIRPVYPFGDTEVVIDAWTSTTFSSPFSSRLTCWISRRGSVGRPRRCEITSIHQASPFSPGRTPSRDGLADKTGRHTHREAAPGSTGRGGVRALEHQRRPGCRQQQRIGESHDCSSAGRRYHPGTIPKGSTYKPPSLTRSRKLSPGKGSVNVSISRCLPPTPRRAPVCRRADCGRTRRTHVSSRAPRPEDR